MTAMHTSLDPSPAPSPRTSPAPTPYAIAVPAADLSRLHSKLAQTRLPDELAAAGRAYGAPLADITRLVSHWLHSYDWRAHEARINAALPQFTLDVAVAGFGTLNIHFVHARSAVRGAVPLLFVHGWPGSFLEVAKVLPPLTAPASEDSPAFHVVAYSLPGFGFSEGPTRQGFAAKQHAEVGHRLMLSLGYNEYVTQGGDWGYIITRRIAQMYGGEHCRATHSNMGVGAPPKLLKNPLLYLRHAVAPYTPYEKAGFARTAWFRSQGYGYAAEQSTQPQTLGYSLGDSPVGLLAWIYEKLVSWSDDYPWSDDEVLTWVSIYWFARAGPAASLRIYYEVARAGDWDLATHRLARSVDVKVGVSRFPKELIVVPKTWVHVLGGGHVVFQRDHAAGGHFAAHEMPRELVADLGAMFGWGGPAYGVVRGKLGYGE